PAPDQDQVWPPSALRKIPSWVVMASRAPGVDGSTTRVARSLFRGPVGVKRSIPAAAGRAAAANTASTRTAASRGRDTDPYKDLPSFETPLYTKQQPWLSRSRTAGSYPALPRARGRIRG